jgi:hypothetical protein
LICPDYVGYLADAAALNHIPTVEPDVHRVQLLGLPAVQPMVQPLEKIAKNERAKPGLPGPHDSL